MCDGNFEIGYTQQTKDYLIEVIAPCGDTVIIKKLPELREINLINGEELIKKCRLFFREFGFGGDQWKIKVTETIITDHSGKIKKSITEKIFL